MSFRFKSIVAWRWLVAAFFVLHSTADAASGKYALVIGNAAYSRAPLPIASKSAATVATKLATLGFEVQHIENLRRREIGSRIASFVGRLSKGDTAIVFYSGYGMQVKGTNYLLAVDAEINHEDDVALNSVNLTTLLERLDESGAGIKLALIDAGQASPFLEKSRGLERGLARITSAPSGTLVQFASRPGLTTDEKAAGLYARAIVDNISTPGLPVELILKRISIAVTQASNGRQVPWLEGNITGDFYFVQGDPGTVSQQRPVNVDWGDWQAKMEKSFAELRKSTSPANTRAQEWLRFLEIWKDDNPESQRDEELRQAAITARAMLVEPGRPSVPTRRVPADDPTGLVWQYPVSGSISTRKTFMTIDGALISAEPGEPIRAAAQGYVQQVTSNREFGEYIVIYHPTQNVFSFYVNVKNVKKLKFGQRIMRGDQIANVRDDLAPSGLLFAITDTKLSGRPLSDYLPQSGESTP